MLQFAKSYLIVVAGQSLLIFIYAQPMYCVIQRAKYHLQLDHPFVHDLDVIVHISRIFRSYNNRINSTVSSSSSSMILVSIL